MRVFLNGTEFDARDYKTSMSSDGLELQFKFGLNQRDYQVEFHLAPEVVIPLSFETRSTVGVRLLVPAPDDDRGWGQSFSQTATRRFTYRLLGRPILLTPLFVSGPRAMWPFQMTFLGETWDFQAATLREAQQKALALGKEDLRLLADRVGELESASGLQPQVSRFDLIG